MALATIIVTLAVVGGFLALDKTVLHLYYDESGVSAPAPQRTAPQTVSTRWYYIPEVRARSLDRDYAGQLPPCSHASFGRRIPAPVNGPPLIRESSLSGRQTIELAVECRE